MKRLRKRVRTLKSYDIGTTLIPFQSIETTGLTFNISNFLKSLDMYTIFDVL